MPLELTLKYYSEMISRIFDVQVYSFIALRKMRKLDEVASSIANNSRSNSRRRTYRLPISIIKLKHLIINPNNKENHDDVNSMEGKRMKCYEDNVNPQGNPAYCVS